MADSGQIQQHEPPALTSDEVLGKLEVTARVSIGTLPEAVRDQRWRLYSNPDGDVVLGAGDPREPAPEGKGVAVLRPGWERAHLEHAAAADPIQVLALVQELRYLRSWVLGLVGPSTTGDGALVLSALRAQEGIGHGEATSALARLARDADLGRACVELAKGHGWNEGTGAQLAEFLDSMLDGPGMVRLGAGENERRLTEVMGRERDETGLSLVRGMVADHKLEVSLLRQENEALRQEVAERDSQLEDVGRVLGKVVVYATLADGEAPAERPDHAATASMWRVVQERHLFARALAAVLELAQDVDGLTATLTEATGEPGPSRTAAESLSRKLLELGRVTDREADTGMDLQAGGRGMTLEQVRAAFPYAAVVVEQAALSDAELAALVADACKAQGKALPGAESTLTVKPLQVLALARELVSIRGRKGLGMITKGVDAAARARALGCDETTAAEAAAYAAGCFVLGESPLHEPLSPVPVSLVDTFRQLDAHLVALHPGTNEARERLARLERWIVSLVCALVPFRDVARVVRRAPTADPTVPMPLLTGGSEEALLSGDFHRLLHLLADVTVKGLNPRQRGALPLEEPDTLELFEAAAKLLRQHVPEAERAQAVGLVRLLQRRWDAVGFQLESLAGRLAHTERRHGVLAKAAKRLTQTLLVGQGTIDAEWFLSTQALESTLNTSAAPVVATIEQITAAARHVAQVNDLRPEVITDELLHFLGLLSATESEQAPPPGAAVTLLLTRHPEHGLCGWFSERLAEDKPGKGLWCAPGGGALPGEQAKANARRELEEETGVVLPEETLEARGHVDVTWLGGNRNRVSLFLAWLPEGVTPSLPQGGDEHERQGPWTCLPLEKARHYPLTCATAALVSLASAMDHR